MTVSPQWEEGFEGGSTLFGPGSDFLLRRTGYIATPGADAITADGTTSGSAGDGNSPAEPSSWQLGHATWSSRVDDRAEITLRYLRGGAMVAVRTLILLGSGCEMLSTVVSEETFVRAAAAL